MRKNWRQPSEESRSYLERFDTINVEPSTYIKSIKIRLLYVNRMVCRYYQSTKKKPQPVINGQDMKWLRVWCDPLVVINWALKFLHFSRSRLIS